MAVQESAFPSLLLHFDLGNKDKKRIEGQHQEKKMEMKMIPDENTVTQRTQ